MAEAKGIRMGGGYVSLGVDRGPLDKGLEAAKASFQTWGKGIAALGAAIASAGVAVAAPFLSGLSDFISWGSEMRNTMRMVNMSFDDTDLAMDGMRLSAEELPVVMRTMDSFMVDAATSSGNTAQALRDMGLSFAELNAMTRIDRLLAFAGGLDSIGDAALRSDRIRSVFGGRGGLTANIVGGAAGIRARAARADELEGASGGRQAFLAATALGRAKSEMNTAINSVSMALAFAAAPVMQSFYELVTKIAIGVRRWADANRPLLTTIFYIADKVILAGMAIGFLGGAVYAASYAFSFIQGAIAIVGGVFSWLAGIVGLILTPVFWALSATMFVVNLGLSALAFVAGVVASGAFSVLSFLVGGVVSAAFLAMSIAMAVVKSGFGVLTVASIIWGAVCLGWSLTVSAATFAYGIVLIALIPVFLALKVASFLWGIGVSTVTAIVTGVTIAYTAAVTALAFVMFVYKNLVLLAGIALGVYLFFTGAATAATMADTVALILNAIGITGTSAATIIATSALIAHIAALVLDVFGIDIHTVMTALATSGSIALTIATIAKAIAMGVATIAAHILSIALFGVWLMENLVSGGAWLIISALVVLMLMIGGFALFVVIAAAIAVAWEAVLAIFRYLANAVADVGRAIVTMFVSFGSSVSRFASNIGAAFGTALSGIADSINRFFTSFMESAGVAFEHVVGIGTQAFSALRDAFHAGEWELIWNIVVVAAQLAWIRMYPAVMSFTDSMVDLFGSAWNIIKSLFITVWGEIKAIAFEGIAAILTATLAITPTATLRAPIIAQAAGFVIDARAARQTARIAAAAVGNTRADIDAWVVQFQARQERDDAIAAGDEAEAFQLQVRLDQLEWDAAIARRDMPAPFDPRNMPGMPGNLLQGGGQTSTGTFNRFAAMGWTGAAGMDAEPLAIREARLAREAMERMAAAQELAAARLEQMEERMEEEIRLLQRFEGVVMH